MRRLATSLCLGLALAACTTTPRDVPRAPSAAWDRPGETELAATLERGLRGGESAFHLIVSGLDAFGMRAALAERAQRTLDLQYYIVRMDTTTQLLLHRVLRAADRGVRVRLLVDDLYAGGRDFDLATFAVHPNVQVRVFNPFLARGPLGLSRVLEFLGDPARLNRRMHNKLWVADNVAAILGGRNLGDEYFDADETVNFTDLDVLAVGPATREVSRSFDEYWNSDWSVPVEAFVRAPPGPEALATMRRDLAARVETFRDTPYALALREANPRRRLLAGEVPLSPAAATVLYDSPGVVPRQPVGTAGDGRAAGASGAEVRSGTDGAAVMARVRPWIEAATGEVLLITPYFVPSQAGVDLLAMLVRRGVRVRVLTNSLASTDVPAVHAAYARWRGALLAAGVELHETRPEPRAGRRGSAGPAASSGASLHAKAVVIDGRHLVIGSMNLDPRSRLHNTEVAVLVDSAPLAGQVRALFDEAVRPRHAFRVALEPSARDPAALAWRSEENGVAVRYDDEPLAGFWRRLVASVAGALAPEEWL